MFCFVSTFSYRRAPKHPFPAAANDCIASYKYFVDNAEKFNVDPTRIAVVGEPIQYMITMLILGKL